MRWLTVDGYFRVEVDFQVPTSCDEVIDAPNMNDRKEAGTVILSSSKRQRLETTRDDGGNLSTGGDSKAAFAAAADDHAHR